MRTTCLAILFFLSATSWADETPETVLIRRALDNDKFGHRRGEVDLAMSVFGPQMVVYAGNHNLDPRAWTVRYEDREALRASVEQDLRANRYEIERLVPSIAVRGNKALVVTVDSGQVVERGSGAARPVKEQRLWTFAKIEENWLATSLVRDLGEESMPVSQGGGVAQEIAAVLQDEEEGWESGSVGAIAGLCDEEFIGYDGTGESRPEKWQMLFSNGEEWRKWLEKRLKDTKYAIDRKVIYAQIGAGGKEALALTQETVSTSYEKGSASHSLDRYVLWALSQQSGSWKITRMLYRLGMAQ